MNLSLNKRGLFFGIVKLALISIIILLISYFFVNNKMIIGPVLLMLGLMSLILINLSKTTLNILWPDIIFGLIDNGILAIFIIAGLEVFGVLGAVIGGLVGNSITDGFAGLFEGYEWEKMSRLKIKDKRTILTVAIGKLSGCLIGAGLVLTIAWSIFGLV